MSVLFLDFIYQCLLFPFTLFSCAAAEGQMDCLLLLVNREQSADVIDSPDIQGQ